MASRFYFPLTEAAPVAPPAPSGSDWEESNGVTAKLLASPDSSTLTTTAYTPDAADDLTDKDACHRQYVSDPLMGQTLSGNVKAQFQCQEANTNNNLFLTLKIVVVPFDGSSVLATLLAITRDTTNELNPLAAQNRNFPSTALSSYACAPGDRIVVEVGLGGLPTAAVGTQGHNGSIRWGCNASSGDLTEDDSSVSTLLRPWIEFSNTINFPVQPPRSMHQKRQRVA